MKQAAEHNRRMLVDMATGNRSGYWVEVLHHADTGAAAYILHNPAALRSGATWRDMPALPSTWDAIQMQYKWSEDDDSADASMLPKYDEKRTYAGDVQNTTIMAALLKWAKK